MTVMWSWRKGGDDIRQSATAESSPPHGDGTRQPDPVQLLAAVRRFLMGDTAAHFTINIPAAKPAADGAGMISEIKT